MLSFPLFFIQSSSFVVGTRRAMAPLPLLLVVFLSACTAMTFAKEKSTPSLYRSPTGGLSFGNFKKDPFHYLWEKTVTWSMVGNQLHCTYLCVGEPKCYSSIYLCELLATDKYRATKTFRANATFHHYSPWVRHNYLSLHFFSLVRIICSCTVNAKKLVLITNALVICFPRPPPPPPPHPRDMRGLCRAIAGELPQLCDDFMPRPPGTLPQICLT